MKFILPKVIALTAIVGLATLVMGLLFKVLLGVTVLALIAKGIASLFMDRGQYGMGGRPGYGQFPSDQYNNNVKPFGGPWNRGMQHTTNTSGITPIN